MENFGASFSASELGIEGEVVGATLTGTPLTFAGVQVEGLFTALVRLRDALVANDSQAIGRAQRLFDIAESKLDKTRAITGSRVATLELIKK